MEKLSFKTVHASVRPARVAILVDSSDPDWQHTCLRIVEFYSQLWGGAYNVIVPTDGISIDERFWSLLEAFDPDYIFRYTKSLEDLALSYPDRYNEILEKQVDASVAQSGFPTRDAAKIDIDKRLRNTWISKFDVAQTLHQEIKARLTPFWFEQWVVDAQPITAGSVPPFHLTNITKIITSTEHPNRIAVIETAEELLPRLWYGAVTGLVSSAARKEFEQVEIRAEQVTFRDDNIGQLIRFTIASELRPPRPFRADSDLEIAPYYLSMLQLGLYRSTRYADWQERAIAVAGNTLEDFCLYYCLSRLRDRVVWVLPSLVEKALGGPNAQVSNSEMSFLFELHNVGMRSSQSEGGLECISYSLKSNQIDNVIRQLNCFDIWRREEIVKSDDLYRLVRFPLSVVERDNFQRDISLQFSDYLSVSPFSTPKPKHFEPVQPYEHRWITQLSFVGEAPPKQSQPRCHHRSRP